MSARPRSRRARGWRWALWFAGLAIASAAAAPSKEYQVKAAFLFNFTKFVEWPADRFASDTAPIVIAVVGRNPFDDELANLVRDRFVNGRPIVVRLLSAAEATRADRDACHVLFVAAGEEPQLARLAGPAVRLSALTVGESEDFAARGGMVTFVVVDHKVRFEINRAAAAAAGLKLSAQLQKLAVPARPRAGTLPP